MDSDLQDAFEQSSTTADIGQNLLNLIRIDDEFMAVTKTTDHATYIDLKDVYRGMLDTAPAAHSAGAKIYLIFVGAGLSDTAFTQPYYVDIKLRPKSRTDEVTIANAVTISFQMRRRVCRPYPPVEFAANSSSWPSSVDLSTLKPAGTTLDHRGAYVTFLRRDYWTFDEVSGLLTDAQTLDDQFPTVNNTQYKAKVINDPLGTPTTLFTSDLNEGVAAIFLSRTKILRYTAGVIPATLRVEVTTNHDIEGENLDSLQALGQNFTIAASSLDDDFNFGAFADGPIAGPWTAPTTGSYSFTLGTAFSTGEVQANLNGGGFSVIVAAGATTGTLAGVMSGDAIRIQHTQTGDNSHETFLTIDAPSTTVDAYAVLEY